jgi:hypothetical protein
MVFGLATSMNQVTDSLAGAASTGEGRPPLPITSMKIRTEKRILILGLDRFDLRFRFCMLVLPLF